MCADNSRSCYTGGFGYVVAIPNDTALLFVWFV